MKKKLHITICNTHPAYKWAKEQSDSVNALGHIGTHIDCYSRVPHDYIYEVGTVVIDCREEMPSVNDIDILNCKGRAIILYTGILNTKGYGTNEYGGSNSFLNEESLDVLLSKDPKFILIDACGIGNHGDEHIRFDKKCERQNCFVIENIFLDDEIVSCIDMIKIVIDNEVLSSGKLCKIYTI